MQAKLFIGLGGWIVLYWIMLFEITSNLYLEKGRGALTLARIMSYGLISAGMAFVS